MGGRKGPFSGRETREPGAGEETIRDLRQVWRILRIRQTTSTPTLHVQAILTGRLRILRQLHDFIRPFLPNLLARKIIGNRTPRCSLCPSNITSLVPVLQTQRFRDACRTSHQLRRRILSEPGPRVRASEPPWSVGSQTSITDDLQSKEVVWPGFQLSDVAYWSALDGDSSRACGETGGRRRCSASYRTTHGAR